MGKKKRITLREVAKQAGVSPTAVSFAFNAPHQLSVATRDRILATAEELGYQPHPVARTLATGRTHSIGLVTPATLEWTLSDPMFHILLGAAGAACDRHNLYILLVPARSDRSPRSLQTIAADGFLMFGIHQDHPLVQSAERTSRPVVIMDGDERVQAVQVGIDDEGGAFQAAQHLLQKGHRRIAVAARGPMPDGVPIPAIEKRLAGYRRAVEEAGLPAETLQIVQTEGLISAGFRSFQKIWSLNPKPTAVLCASDVRAVGILNGARANGIRIPEDLAIVGFGDIPETAETSPTLTTVHHDLEERTQRAIDMLVSMIDERHGKRHKGDEGGEDEETGAEEKTDEAEILTRLLFPTWLIVREST